MATPYISPIKLNENSFPNLIQPRINTTVPESYSKKCLARHVTCNNMMNNCRVAYATWCPVCEDQEQCKQIYRGGRRRSKSEGMDLERNEKCYTKATSNEAYYHHTEGSCTKEYPFTRKQLNYEYEYNSQNYSASAREHQSCINNYLPMHSLSNKQTDMGDNNCRPRYLIRPCENHIEPNRDRYYEPRQAWPTTEKWVCHNNKDELMPIHERYYYEVEVLRKKLHKLRDNPNDWKRSRQSCEAEYNVPSFEVGLKRPRDNSPSMYSSSATRKLLPTIPPSKSLAYKKALLPKEASVLSSGSATSVSSDSEFNYSGCEEEELQADHEVDYEEDEHAITHCGRPNFTSCSPAHMVCSISTREQGKNSAIQTSTDRLHPALRASLFSHIAPYIRFYSHDAKGDSLPPCIQKLLKWKLSTITPVVVRRTILNSNFKLVRKSNEWCGTWGKHMKSLCFKTLREYQKINHFPGTFQIGRKDRLWKNLFRLMAKFGKKEFGFIPRTYVLPQDNKLLRSAWEKNCGKERWIVKPPASARGTGIKVIHKWTQIPKKCPLVVQKYIADPYLINGNKFDLRLYVLVTSINPLRIYMYDNGLVRFASVKYSNEMSSLTDRYMHLTNYSINKLSSQYTQNEDASACQGHKWSVQALWTYLEQERGVDVKALWDTLVDLVIKTIISGESAISQLTSANLASRYCSYELFGIDVLFDENLKPWLLEVNISPSLHSSSPLDLAVKGPLVQDLMNMAGYQIPNKLSSQVQSELAESLGVRAGLCYDRRLYTTALSNEEKLKHVMYQQSATREDYLGAILLDLTPDDVRHLVCYEDELTQMGNFQKIFPTTETYDYHQYFEAPRYYNMLFDAWETKHTADRSQGIAVLETLCRKQVHLDTTQIPPKRTKVSMSPSENELKSPDLDLPEDIPEDTIEGMSAASLSKMKVACSTIWRAARPRGGRPGLVTKPYPRSTYTACRPVKSARELAEFSI